MSEDERAHLQTINERDRAEDALSQAYFLVTGESPEWSNIFGYDQAIEDIDDAQTTLRKSIADLTESRDGWHRRANELEARVRSMEMRGSIL